jgi:hypothetical protein
MRGMLRWYVFEYLQWAQRSSTLARPSLEVVALTTVVVVTFSVLAWQLLHFP